MTVPFGATDPIPVKRATGAAVAPDMPDTEAMKSEISDDRRHERFLLRAALIAAIAVAIVVSLRMWI